MSAASALLELFQRTSDGLAFFEVQPPRRLVAETVNPAAARIFGLDPAAVAGRSPHELFPPDVADALLRAGQLCLESGTATTTEQCCGPADQPRWFQTLIVPLGPPGHPCHRLAVNWRDVTHQAREVEARVAERTRQLAAVNRELEAFCYSVSHDLRAPLRAVDGFSKALLEDYNERLDDEGRDMLGRVRAASRRMDGLIDDLLTLSRISRAEMRRRQVSLSDLARTIAAALHDQEPRRRVQWHIEPDLFADGDPALLRVLLENLLGNAWKYTSRHDHARIEFGRRVKDGEAMFFVRDDGAGFDPTYADKLFQPFQRLHRPDEFEGHGIGLATVQRIVHRHGGRAEATGAVEEGATFLFTLGP